MITIPPVSILLAAVRQRLVRLAWPIDSCHTVTIFIACDCSLPEETSEAGRQVFHNKSWRYGDRVRQNSGHRHRASPSADARTSFLTARLSWIQHASIILVVLPRGRQLTQAESLMSQQPAQHEQL